MAPVVIVICLDCIGSCLQAPAGVWTRIKNGLGVGTVQGSTGLVGSGVRHAPGNNGFRAPQTVVGMRSSKQRRGTAFLRRSPCRVGELLNPLEALSSGLVLDCGCLADIWPVSNRNGRCPAGDGHEATHAGRRSTIGFDHRKVQAEKAKGLRHSSRFLTM